MPNKKTNNQLIDPKSIISVKEARKLLSKGYKDLTDNQVSEIVTLLDIIARDFVSKSVPN